MSRSVLAQEANLEKLYRGMTSPLRLLPDFLIIGTQRGGTTSLYNYLTACPGVGSASVKELRFFDRKFHKGTSWYKAHFPTRIQKRHFERTHGQMFVTGEASTNYLFYPHTPKRVAQVVPDVKLIVLLRNPVDRAYSHYKFEVEHRQETLSFEDALAHEEERTCKERERILADESYVSFAHSRYSYLVRGIYVDQLEAWMKFFPREQFLILRSEDFYADPGTTLERVSQFLTVPQLALRGGTKVYEQYNHTPNTRMDAATRKRLISYFEPHNQRLSNFLEMTFDWNR